MGAMDVLAAVVAVLAVVLNGVMAGVFFAFSVSVMPGLDTIDEERAADAMRSANRKILNPAFLAAFTLSPVASLAAGVLMLLDGRTGAGVLLLAAALAYAVGCFAVTAAVNVPMNNALEAGTLAWSAYSPRWTRWNHLRTWVSTAALALAGAALCLPG